MNEQNDLPTPHEIKMAELEAELALANKKLSDTELALHMAQSDVNDLSKMIESERERRAQRQQIRVISTSNREYITAHEVGIISEGHFPCAQIQHPVYMTSERIVMGEVVHVFGPFDDEVFTYDDFVLFADAGHLSSVSAQEAQQIVDFLKLRKLDSQIY